MLSASCSGSVSVSFSLCPSTKPLRFIKTARTSHSSSCLPFPAHTALALPPPCCRSLSANLSATAATRATEFVASFQPTDELLTDLSNAFNSSKLCVVREGWAGGGGVGCGNGCCSATAHPVALIALPSPDVFCFADSWRCCGCRCFRLPPEQSVNLVLLYLLPRIGATFLKSF